MKVLNRRHWLAGLIIAAIVLFGFVQVASANASARAQQQIEEFRQMLQEQAAADEENLTEKDRNQTEVWLQEAEVLLANGRHEAVSRRLRRVEYSLDLIRALVGSTTIDALADRQEAFYHTSKQQITQFEAEIRRMNQRKDGLERELQSLR